MRTIGIYTHDFSVFHDLVRLLKERDVEFFSLRTGKIPPWINVVITTEESKSEVEFDQVIIVSKDDPRTAVEQAVLSLGRNGVGGMEYHSLIVGIDPGERPGVAVYGDRELLTTAKVEFPEDTAAMVKRMIDFYKADHVIVRIGDGAPTYRNRIINVLLPLNVKIEIVDERSTTFQHKTPDIQAAIQIALKQGRKVDSEMDVVPKKGEIEDLKRRSRIMSRGRFTISNDQAEAVAKGMSTLRDEVALSEKQLFGKNQVETQEKKVKPK